MSKSLFSQVFLRILIVFDSNKFVLFYKLIIHHLPNIVNIKVFFLSFRKKH